MSELDDIVARGPEAMAHTDNSEYGVAKSWFRQAFAERLGHRHPNHPRSKNFMTPDILGYVRHGDVTVEVSTGLFLGQRFYGLTWPRVDGQSDPRDTTAESLAEVIEILGAS